MRRTGGKDADQEQERAPHSAIIRRAAMQSMLYVPYDNNRIERRCATKYNSSRSARGEYRMFAQRVRSASPAVWFVIVCLYLIATRWPLAPHYLYYFDSANFALALEHFDPALHQPQPPGYPLFVGLTKLIHLFVLRPEHVFLIAGLLAACGAVVLIRLLAREVKSAFR